MDDFMNRPIETQETEFPNETPADNATSDMAETPEAESPKTTETTATETAGATETADDEEKEEATAEAISKFRELTAARMSAIGQQLFQMKKIPGKRGIDYSKEDVEKIFTYLRGEIDKCEGEFIKKFDEKKADKFNFDFKF